MKKFDAVALVKLLAEAPFSADGGSSGRAHDGNLSMRWRGIPLQDPDRFACIRTRALTLTMTRSSDGETLPDLSLSYSTKTA